MKMIFFQKPYQRQIYLTENECNVAENKDRLDLESIGSILGID